MKARILLAQIILLMTCVTSVAQVFHYKTGQVIPSSQKGTLIWKEGVFNGYIASFGTLVTTETNKRNANIINIPVVKLKALNQNQLGLPIFILNGGPGESNLRHELIFEQLLVNHDLILIGYRGVDGSVKLDCPELKKALFNENLDIENADSLFTKAFEYCLNNYKKEQIDISGYSMEYVVDDIELLRKSMGIEHFFTLSFSYGTMLAQLYNQKYPFHMESGIMIGARPLGEFVISSEIFRKQLALIEQNNVELHNLSNWIYAILSNPDQSNLNTFRLSLFIYGTMYSKEGIDKLKKVYLACSDSNFSPLIDAYNNFFKNYPGELVLGELMLKKQQYIQHPLNNRGNCTITNSLNKWYNTCSIPNDKSIGIFSKIDSTNFLIINSAVDVASPYYLIQEKLLPLMPNAQLEIIPNSSHLDIFVDPLLRKALEEKVVQFFEL